MPVLDVNGNPIEYQKSIAQKLPGGDQMAIHGRDLVPYEAASMTSPELAGSNPWLWSPDLELNPYRDRIVSRARDLVRNNGFASGAVNSILDNVVGSSLRLVAKPDYRALAALTGNKGFTAEWADEFGRKAEALFRVWADDPQRYCDASRHLTFGQMARVALRHKLIDGDALAVLAFNQDRVAPGRARYATAVQLVDPDRLSNPNLAFDTQDFRGGVEIDGFGVPVAYFIREAHPGDWFDAAKALSWQRIPRETTFGRPIVIHDYDHDRAGQHRGGAGILAPVLARFMMLDKYDRSELQAAILNAVFSVFITSPFDPASTQDAFGDTLGSYQEGRVGYHAEKRLAIGENRIPFLFPGEEISTVKGERPATNFDPFEHAVLRSIAAQTGQSAEQLSKDYSKTNYSSARAALLEAWKTLSRRRNDFSVGFCSPIYAAWLEEAFENGELPLPDGAPDFLEARGAYSRCRWLGPGRGWVDPLKERQGAVLGIQAGFSTLEHESAEQGNDWEEVLDQRAIEIKRFKELGIAYPSWSGEVNPVEEAADDETPEDVSAKPTLQ